MSPPAEAAFGDLLRRYRMRAGLTQESLAERAGLSARAVSALESGARRAPYRETVRLLAGALGLGSAEREALTAAARPPRARAAARGAGTGAGVSPALSPPGDLPVSLTSFVGRADEVAALARIVEDPSVRLVTLTGVGGCGKTRLALEVARAARDRFADGSRLVELAPVAEGGLVPQAVAAAFDVREAPGVPLLATLQHVLATRRLLLVLDNCEHLINACAELAARMLAACPGLSILATSRESLRVPGERQWWVSPLPMPDTATPLRLEELAGVAAVQLFVERAQTVAPGFCLTGANAAAVADICSRLDGIPLAIELAAARVRVLAVEQVAARLDDALQVLTGGSRTVPDRQRTLRAALDWSYNLLSEPERAVFRRLSVFAGGCDLEAVEAVCAWADRSAPEVLELLTGLVDRSLVQVEAGAGSAWYWLLEPVRQYAALHLTAGGEVDTARSRHAAYYVALAERAAPELRGPEQLAWLRRLDRAQDNLRAALHWADERGDRETSARLAVALVPFWEVHGQLSEGRRWLDAVLSAAPAPPLPVALQVKAMIGAGRLAISQSDLEAAEGWLDQGRTLACEVGDQGALAESLTWLALVRRRQRAYGDAVQLLEQSLPLHEALGDAAGGALALFRLGVTVWDSGDGPRAIPFLEESLWCFHALGDLRFAAVSCLVLGSALLECGDRERSAVLLREGLSGLRDLGDRAFMLPGLFTLASLAAQTGQPRSAARLLGAAQALHEALTGMDGATLVPTDRQTHDRTLSLIRAHLDEGEIAEAIAAGRALTLDEALEEALGEMTVARPSEPSSE